jgi:hypothetical protein
VNEPFEAISFRTFEKKMDLIQIFPNTDPGSGTGKVSNQKEEGEKMKPAPLVMTIQ